jgi:hypothetical protein
MSQAADSPRTMLLLFINTDLQPTAAVAPDPLI